MPLTQINSVIAPFPAPTSAYLHIPFCRRRCYYCDFPIAVVGDKPPIGQDFGTIAHYVNVLCEEIQQLTGTNPALETVFLGGGTPSLLTVGQLDRLLTTLDQQFGIATDAEISMEIDPGTFDLAKLQGFQTAGVNRFSLGVQAFQPELLALCGRSHTVEEVYAAIQLFQQAKVQNFSLDLISGLPHQTLADWQASLQQAIVLAPTHISCYDLTIETMTVFGKQYKPGLAPLPDDDATAAMYRTAQQTLTAAGYEHYEISNYAKPGFQCRHNRVYWQNRPFYGFGMGATSYVNGDRLARPRKTNEYYDWVKTNPAPTAPDLLDTLLDTLMLGLRLAEGLDRQALVQQFGESTIAKVWTCLQAFQPQSWIATIPDLQQGDRLRLTDPEGFLFSNVVLVALFEAFESNSSCST